MVLTVSPPTSISFSPPHYSNKEIQETCLVLCQPPLYQVVLRKFHVHPPTPDRDKDKEEDDEDYLTLLINSSNFYICRVKQVGSLGVGK